MKMLAVRRQEAIKAFLLEKESITINEVVDKFNVSVETVRRDFDLLSSEGFLTKVYGGAVLKKRTSALPSKKMLNNTFASGKERVAARAARFVKPGDTIFLDNSSAVFHMCKDLVNLDLTVLTNSQPVIASLKHSKTLKLICIGGRYDAKEEAFLGPLTVEFISHFQVDRAFLSCKSFDMDRGLTATDERVAEVKQKMMACANQTCLLVDHSKFGTVSFAQYGNFDDVACLFTDAMVSDDWRSFFERHQVRLFECCEDKTYEPSDISEDPGEQTSSVL